MAKTKSDMDQCFGSPQHIQEQQQHIWQLQQLQSQLQALLLQNPPPDLVFKQLEVCCGRPN